MRKESNGGIEMKKIILCCFFVLFLFTLKLDVYADDVDVVLDSDGSDSAFTVKNNSLSSMMTIKGDGNIGIGTSTPEEGLHISGDDFLLDNNYWIRWKEAGGDIKPVLVKDSNDDTQLRSSVGKNILFMHGGTEKMRLDGSGNVGIGISNPQNKLDVDGFINVTNGYYYRSNDSSGTPRALIGKDGNDTKIVTASGTNIKCFTGGKERMRIQSNGKIGIGTSAPNYLLELNSSHPDIFINANEGHADLYLNGGASIGDSRILFMNDAVAKFAMGYDVSDDVFLIRPGSVLQDSTPLAMNGSGNVGIGTSEPAQKLHIKDGNIRMSNNYAIHMEQNSGTPITALRMDSDNAMSIYNRSINIKSGKVGIGTGTAITPARTLHVNQYMRLEPASTAPSSPVAGDIYFDSTDNKLKCFDGSNWQSCW